MWNFIIDATQGNAAPACAADSAGCSRDERSVVLTTHSMEECEALCTRVGILDQVCSGLLYQAPACSESWSFLARASSCWLGSMLFWVSETIY